MVHNCAITMPQST